MAKALCGICFEDYPIAEFRIYSCGHCFCISCIAKHKSNLKKTTCPQCRKLVGCTDGHQIFLSLSESNAERAERVIGGLRPMGVNTEAKSVTRAGKEVERVARDATGCDNDVLRLLHKEVEAFNDRITPLFETTQKQAAEIALLQSELSKALRSITELTPKAAQVTVLETEIRQLKSQLRDAQRITENAVEVAEQAKDATMVARQEKEACLVKAKEDRQAREDVQKEMWQLKSWLEGHQRESRLNKEKVKALRGELKRLKTDAQARSNFEESLRVGGEETHRQTQKSHHVTKSLFDPPESGGPHRSSSPVLTPSSLVNIPQCDYDCLPTRGFPSDWQLQDHGSKKRKWEGGKAVIGFPIELDTKGHVKGIVQLGSRQRGLK